MTNNLGVFPWKIEGKQQVQEMYWYFGETRRAQVNTDSSLENWFKDLRKG